MKLKFQSLFFVLAVALLLGSCIFQKGKLAIEVADANNDCPEVIADGITMTSVEMDGDMVVYTYKVDTEAFRNICINLGDPKTSKTLLRNMVAEFDKDFTRELLAASMGVKFVYECEDGSRQVAMLTHEELEAAKNSPLRGDDLFDAQLEVAKNKLPIDAGGGMRIVQFAKEGRTLNCYVDITESGLSMSEVRSNVANLTAKDLFTDDDIEDDPLLKEAVKRGFNIQYIYCSATTPEEATFLLSNAELRRIMND